MIPAPGTNATPQEINNWARELTKFVNDLERRITPGNVGGYEEFTNLTETRTLDADATTVAEVADVLGTLTSDLTKMNILRR